MPALERDVRRFPEYSLDLPPEVKEPPPARALERSPDSARLPQLPVEHDAPPVQTEDEFFPPAPSTPLWRTTPAHKPAAETPIAPRLRRRNLAFAAFALAAGGTATWWIRREPKDVSLNIDRADALAIRSDGDMIVAEGPELVTLSPEGKPLGKVDLPEGPIDDLSWDQGSLWSVDGRTPTVLERRDGARPTVFHLNHVPHAVYAHDKYLWTAEKNGSSLHQFLVSRSILGAMLQPLDLYELPGLTPQTFALDDEGTLWLVDMATRQLYRLRPEGGSYKQVASTPLSPMIGPDAEIRSLRLKDDAIWILVRPANSDRSILRRLILSRLTWTPA